MVAVDGIAAVGVAAAETAEFSDQDDSTVASAAAGVAVGETVAPRS